MCSSGVPAARQHAWIEADDTRSPWPLQPAAAPALAAVVARGPCAIRANCWACSGWKRLPGDIRRQAAREFPLRVPCRGSSRACATAIRSTRCCGRCCRRRRGPDRARVRRRRGRRPGAGGAATVIHKYAGRALLVATGSARCIAAAASAATYPYAETPAAAAGWSARRWRRSRPIRRSTRSSCPAAIRSRSPTTSWPSSAPTPCADPAPAPAAHPHPPAGGPAERVDAGLLAWLRGLPAWPLVVVVHANHPNEFDANVDAAMRPPAMPVPCC